MKTIWKYTLEVKDEPQDLYVPLGSELLEVHHQDDDIVLWFIVNTEAKYEQRRTFRIYGTGWEMDETEVIDHLKTVHIRGYVWHIFEVKEGRVVGRRYNIEADQFRDLIESGKWRHRDVSDS